MGEIEQQIYDHIISRTIEASSSGRLFVGAIIEFSNGARLPSLCILPWMKDHLVLIDWEGETSRYCVA